MYEGCDAPEYRKTGYCIRHKETGPRSIFIDTSKLVNEESNEDYEDEITDEDEFEDQEEKLCELDPLSNQLKNPLWKWFASSMATALRRQA